ncbi:DNA-3-methyladenine glycosylase [Lunatibacter salilacus]|uniref:DNA-3-methyladenine glycosylase n=1 Tax=Lunatibacter salilacus TaxID=2483804 RepID=UPI00131B9AFB|nr:DNA-3-methyladenine glycosylase [Lunatibacter salilacus]
MNSINLSIDPKSLESSFRRIADELLNKSVLVSGFKIFRICEIEFYYKDTLHNDSYTHGHKQQKTSGLWYQHGSGLDITCGNENAFGGILIRAIQEIENQGKVIDDAYIYGPLNCLQALFSSFSNIEKHQVTFGFEKAIPNMLSQEEILSVPRTGLNKNLNLEMHSKMYRFFIFPKKQHDPKGEIIASLRGIIDDERLKEMFGWKTLPESGK